MQHTSVSYLEPEEMDPMHFLKTKRKAPPCCWWLWQREHLRFPGEKRQVLHVAPSTPSAKPLPYHLSHLLCALLPREMRELVLVL